MPTGIKRDFWDYVRKTRGCWYWTGARASNGYGNVRRNGRNTTAHRFAYEEQHGPVPEGQELLHWCDNKLCVRVHPDHVQPGTHMANVRDCVSKGRHANGERHGNAKLSEADVERVREAYLSGTRQRDLAAVWGVNQSAISKIVSGKLWRTA